MRRIVNSTYISLDGLIQKMDVWHFDYVDDEVTAIQSEDQLAADAVLMGRLTYDSFAAAWPTRTGDDYADRLNAMPKYVASTTLKDPEWNNTTVLEGDLVDAVARLKDEPGGDILMFGFGPVAQTLLQAGLLDELKLWVHPVLAGTGEPSDLLLRQGNFAKLDLTGTRALGSGVVILSYAPPSDG